MISAVFEILRLIIQIFSILFAGCAAYFWYRSAYAYVNAKQFAEQEYKRTKIYPYQNIDLQDGSDIIETLKRQSLWNKKAALQACFAIMAQIIYTNIPLIELLLYKFASVKG